MRALVLGNSDTAGVFSGGETWTQIVRATLQESDPELVFTDVTFSPLGTQAPGVAAGLVRDHEADLVILPVGTFAFTTTFTALRVRRLLGRRAARLYKRAENRFDNSTRQRGAWRDRLNRTVRRTVRTVVGADPLASPGIGGGVSRRAGCARPGRAVRRAGGGLSAGGPQILRRPPGRAARRLPRRD